MVAAGVFWISRRSVNQYLPAVIKKCSLAQASGRAAGPVLLSCEVAQPPKPSAPGVLVLASTLTFLLSYFLTSYFLSYLRVGDIFHSGRFQRPAALVILRFSILLARLSLGAEFRYPSRECHRKGPPASMRLPNSFNLFCAMDTVIGRPKRVLKAPANLPELGLRPC